MLRLSTKPEEFAGFTPVTKLEQQKTASHTKNETKVPYCVHPIGESEYQRQADYQKDDSANLSQVHMTTLPHLQNVKTGVSTPLLGGLC